MSDTVCPNCHPARPGGQVWGEVVAVRRGPGPTVWLLVGVLAALLVVAVAMAWRHFTGGSTEVLGETGARPGAITTLSSDATPGSVPGTPTSSAPTQPTSSAPTQPTTTTTRADPLRGPVRPRTVVTLEREAGGTACEYPTAANSVLAGYPGARCKFWRPSTGLVTGTHLSTGWRFVGCQADLLRRNPQYAKGQTNTWWVWLPGDDGTQDWFPLTAMSQGASGQPVNLVPLCQR